MNNLDNYGCAGGVRHKAPGASHGHSIQVTGTAVARLGSAAGMFLSFIGRP
jgi:hypothetical protein